MITNDYTIADMRGDRSRPEPTLRERRDAVQYWEREVDEWAAELAQHPAWIAQADAAYGAHLEDLRRLLGLTDDYGEIEILTMAEQSPGARALRERYKTAIAADVRINRAHVAYRSAIVPRELSLAEQQLFSARHELTLAEERRAAAIADLEGDR